MEWHRGVSEAVREQPGRVVALFAGLGALGGAAWLERPAVVLETLAIGGVLLTGAAALMPHIKRIWLPGGGIDMRDPAEVGQMSAALQQLRQRDPATVDLGQVDLPGDDLWDGARYRLGEITIASLLADLEGDLAGCEARIFLFDETEQRLMPAYRPASADRPPFGWLVGQGVTGAAYRDGVRVVATGESTHDDTFELTPEMKERFADLTAVASVPLVDREWRIIGALSLSTTKTDTRLAFDDAEWQHFALAAQVSVALVDLLRVTD